MEGGLLDLASQFLEFYGIEISIGADEDPVFMFTQVEVFVAEFIFFQITRVVEGVGRAADEGEACVFLLDVEAVDIGRDEGDLVLLATEAGPVMEGVFFPVE